MSNSLPTSSTYYERLYMYVCNLADQYEWDFIFYFVQPHCATLLQDCCYVRSLLQPCYHPRKLLCHKNATTSYFYMVVVYINTTSCKSNKCSISETMMPQCFAVCFLLSQIKQKLGGSLCNNVVVAHKIILVARR